MYAPATSHPLQEETTLDHSADFSAVLAQRDTN